MTSKNIFGAAALLTTLASFPQPCRSAQLQLKTETVQAFDAYIRDNESRMDQQLAQSRNFLSVDALPEPLRNKAYADLRQGQILIQNSQASGSSAATPVPGGLIHDWTATIFVPGVSLSQTLALLQDYDRDRDFYGPQVVKSQLLARSGNQFRVFLRLKQTNILTVVFDTEYDVRYFPLDSTRAYSRSCSMRIQQVDNPGQPDERARPAGDDDGFLWRLCTDWRFYQAGGEIYIECRAISLTRDVPVGLGWLVKPFIENIPSESLRFTLDATRNALRKQFPVSAAPAKETPK